MEGMTWYSQIPFERDRPVLVIAEGVMCYLTPGTVRLVLHYLLEKFSRGEIIFDAINGLEKRGARPAAGATYRWSLDNPRDLCAFEPKLRLLTEIPVSRWEGFQRMPTPLQHIIRTLDLIPSMMRMNRLLVYRFEAKAL
jgi:O-methyltransferase involved in polyketide biosynthesis